MLDIARLERIPLSARPLGQKVVGYLGLWPNYRIPPRVEIEIEDFDRVPDVPVIYAMNHTDRYNYWPFQFKLWRAHNRFTATWVKGKYYENALLGKFMELTNNLPTVSRGYVITRDFLSTIGRPPNDEEYAALRGWVDATATHEGEPLPAPMALAESLLTQPRNVLGVAFEPEKANYPEYINAVYQGMMARFVDLNRRCLELGLDILIFPQGTRSIRLLPGHIGLAELALSFRATVVPVGCSGSDRLYPGSSPFAKGGHVVYRMGHPISYPEMERFHVPADFVPFDPRHEKRHRDKLQGYVDVVMDRINDLVDPAYQFGEDATPVETGSNRFVPT